MKEQLFQLIEAYAAARPTGNAFLQRYAADQLTVFLDAIDILPKVQQTEPAPVVEEDGDGED